MKYSLFGKKIRNYRRQYAMSQEELAVAIGVEQAYLADVEQGKSELAPGELIQICNLFRVDLTELLPVEARYNTELREQWVGEINDALSVLNTGQLRIVKAMVCSLSAD